MNKTGSGSRALKKKLQKLLSINDLHPVLNSISELPAKQVINPLFSFLCSTDVLLKWRAVTSMGVVVAGLAYDDMESARIIMRRLMWSLNDESGGIGWGAPEAMGEIMSGHEQLAEEYHRILISYIMPGGNYIEHEILQNGVLWGIGRLAHARPHLFCNSVELLIPYLNSHVPSHRGLAARAAGICNSEKTNPLLHDLKNDTSKIEFYINWHISTVTVGGLIS